MRRGSQPHPVRSCGQLEFLIAQGVEPERISAVGYGETILGVDPEETAKIGAKKNRIQN